MAVAVTTGAIVYWTAGGSGTGSASTGTNVAITAVQTSTPANLYPGGPTQPLSGNFNNPNVGPTYVATVTAAISSVTKAAGAPVGTCDASDYQLTQPGAVNADVPSGTGVGAWTGGSIRMINKSTNQDACKGATVNLAYTIA